VYEGVGDDIHIDSHIQAGHEPTLPNRVLFAKFCSNVTDIFMTPYARVRSWELVSVVSGGDQDREHRDLMVVG
jgi:hypothetical protein